ncbi:PhyH-domain-containing protein [Trichoderma citrinoviride]|uniref:PhyH-domain-containing protein n=1 Tax=Trichoderma citrinoviride TaxID=58853 RepID=A0A2T4AYR7_9HYPO|nr:PhyH-domain-containing protein [Trichoderma citrinoviride]PTB62219.1 PhyH-domain-containing protein [Trichoderma citrinoviride]
MAYQRPLSGGSIPSETGADARLSRYTPSSPPSPRIQSLIDEVNAHGYVVIRNAFSPSSVAAAKAEVARLSADPKTAGPAAAKGRNTFEGFRTQRLYALADKSRVFDEFVLHEDVLALNDWFLDPGYLINSFQSINILPGEKRQTMHYDHGYGVMIALDDYTATNGATVLVPDSHLWDSRRVAKPEEAVPIIMPAGSVLFFVSTLWHGGGANRSEGSRLALTAQYCQPWIRPMENLILAVDWEKLDEMPPRLVDMLGFKVGNPFLGHVDGKSPRRAVAELLKKYKGEKAKL